MKMRIAHISALAFVLGSYLYLKTHAPVAGSEATSVPGPGEARAAIATAPAPESLAADSAPALDHRSKAAVSHKATAATAKRTAHRSAVTTAPPAAALAPQPVADGQSSKWVKELNGIELKDRRPYEEDPCREERCIYNAKDGATLFGVVVRTEGRQPRPLKGDVSEGSYVEKTPAVYVE